MTALSAVLLFFNVQAARPSLAPYIPKMTAPVVNVRAQKTVAATNLPLVRDLLPKESVTSLGSGIIIDRRGFVLTNEHIVAGVTLVRVQLSDEREYLADVVGRDKDLDVALLKLHVGPGERLPVARLGRSTHMRVGDYVVAVGNPYGLTHTVTSGIVSARGRILGVGPTAPLLQTDASINPGNSGGPLYDLDGNVIGVNTAIVAGAHGIGFAVPIDIVERVLPQLEKSGAVTRGFSGMKVSRVPQPIAQALNLKGTALGGALVREISPGGPSERAGIQPGDVIVRWDGVRIESAEALPCVMALSPPGTRVRVQIVRLGQGIARNLEMGPDPSPVRARLHP